MEFTNLSQAIARLEELEATSAAYGHAMGILSVDASTIAPAKSAPGRGKTMEVLSSVVYGLVADPANLELVQYLEAHDSELTDLQRRQTQLLRKSVEQLSRIPQEEYVAYSVLMNEADVVWRNAKTGNDFASFAPILEQIVAYNRKFSGYYNPNVPAYDALLNEYEEGLTTAVLDEFFARLRSELVPLIHAIGEKAAPDTAFLNQSYPIPAQKELTSFLMDVMGLDKGKCVLCESEHPFTSGFNNADVRITTHYYETMPTFAIYSTIHEGGHALYEMGMDDAYNFTSVAGGASMSIHESQSRFYENLIGRSLPFVEKYFPKMQELFPEQLAGVTALQMFRAVNKVEPSLIRTEADELTYCMHIMVRYELEKQLIDGTLAVADLPRAWNGLYKEYLGVEVPNDTLGCLQDSHWAGGMIGYFPSYALGSAYGAQIKHVLEAELGSLEQLVQEGRIGEITGWLRAKIHRHSAMFKPMELFEQVCGKFDPKFYTDYLKEKYSRLYDL
ncbi:MAG: carboxypeptidase M32 [Oscillospiraceae bacterium]|nr:carboxypeptidase M32 [Oscillospiraceae bacterium]